MECASDGLNGCKKKYLMILIFWKIKKDGWLLISPGCYSIELTLKEFKFLTTLSASSSLAISRQKLLNSLEYQNDNNRNRALESLAHRLRNKTAGLGRSPIKTANCI